MVMTDEDFESIAAAAGMVTTAASDADDEEAGTTVDGDNVEPLCDASSSAVEYAGQNVFDIINDVIPKASMKSEGEHIEEVEEARNDHDALGDDRYSDVEEREDVEDHDMLASCDDKDLSKEEAFERRLVKFSLSHAMPTNDGSDYNSPSDDDDEQEEDSCDEELAEAQDEDGSDKKQADEEDDIEGASQIKEFDEAEEPSGLLFFEPSDTDNAISAVAAITIIKNQQSIDLLQFNNDEIVALDNVNILLDQYLSDVEVKLIKRCELCAMDLTEVDGPVGVGSNTSNNSSYYQPYGMECPFCHVAGLDQENNGMQEVDESGANDNEDEENTAFMLENYVDLLDVTPVNLLGHDMQADKDQQEQEEDEEKEKPARMNDFITIQEADKNSDYEKVEEVAEGDDDASSCFAGMSMDDEEDQGLVVQEEEEVDELDITQELDENGEEDEDEEEAEDYDSKNETTIVQCNNESAESPVEVFVCNTKVDGIALGRQSQIEREQQQKSEELMQFEEKVSEEQSAESIEGLKAISTSGTEHDEELSQCEQEVEEPAGQNEKESNEDHKLPFSKNTPVHCRDKNVVVKKLIAKFWQQNNIVVQPTKKSSSSKGKKKDIYSDLIACHVSKEKVHLLKDALEAPKHHSKDPPSAKEEQMSCDRHSRINLTSKQKKFEAKKPIEYCANLPPSAEYPHTVRPPVSEISVKDSSAASRDPPGSNQEGSANAKNKQANYSGSISYHHRTRSDNISVLTSHTLMDQHKDQQDIHFNHDGSMDDLSMDENDVRHKLRQLEFQFSRMESFLSTNHSSNGTRNVSVNSASNNIHRKHAQPLSPLYTELETISEGSTYTPISATNMHGRGKRVKSKKKKDSHGQQQLMKTLSPSAVERRRRYKEALLAKREKEISLGAQSCSMVSIE